jgi:hypothetical protein
MKLWLIFIALALLTVAGLVWPLRRRGSWELVLTIAVLVPAFALLLYTFLGAPEMAGG